MPYRTSRKNGMSRRSTALAPYPGGQTRRQTEEHGDLNVYNRMYQFYNYHADKDILIDEMCRGLVLSLLRISGGSVQEYDEPLGWTAPYWQDHCSHHHAIVFHMKDQRRHSSTFAKTLSSFSGKNLEFDQRLYAEQYDADVHVGHEFLPTWVQLHNGAKMKSLTQVASELAGHIKKWINLQSTGFEGDISVRGLDLVPSRLQLLKRCVVAGTEAYEVVVDDREFEASKVDVSAFTTVTLQNVTPALGDSLMTGDPLSSDTINHVPLKGKMYTFSGPVPKVWDRHRSDLQHLFMPHFFEKGRYLLPNSKLHDETTEDFRTFPKGRFIWSNCIGEDRITFQPGSTQKLKLQYRMRTSVRDFFHKFRNDDISSSKLGRCVCLALEPSIRRQHTGQPISVVMPKFLWKTAGKLDANGDPTSEGTVVKSAVQYEPYHWDTKLVVDKDGLATGETRVAKVARQVFRLNTSIVPTHQNPNPAVVEYLFQNPTNAALGWYQAGESGWTPVLWDSITPAMVQVEPSLGRYVSKGDPIMFNVQINRLYLGSSTLKNFTRLGADKTGIKRKYDEKMVSNMGDVTFDYAQQVGDVFKDHDLQSANQVGVAPLIMEGDDRNAPVAIVSVNVNAEEQAFENALMSMDADPSKAGLQLDVVGSALTALDGIIDTQGLIVKDQMKVSDWVGTASNAAGIVSTLAAATATANAAKTLSKYVQIGTGFYERAGVMVRAAEVGATGLVDELWAGKKAFQWVALAAAFGILVVDLVELLADHLHAPTTKVTGTVNVGNTPTVNIGTMPDISAGDVTVNVPETMSVEMSVDERTALANKIAHAISLRTDIDVNVANTAEVATDIADKVAEKTLTTNVNNTVNVSGTVNVGNTISVANEIAQSIAEQTIDVALQTPNYIAGLIADAIESRQLSVTSSDKDLIGIIDGINTSAADSGSALTVRTLNGDVHLLQKVTVFSGGAIDVSEWNASIHKYRIVYRKPGQDIWRLSSNSVDIGQDINLTVPDGALTATVNIPDTMDVNVINTVDVTGAVGTVEGGQYQNVRTVTAHNSTLGWYCQHLDASKTAWFRYLVDNGVWYDAFDGDVVTTSVRDSLLGKRVMSVDINRVVVLD